MPMSVYESALPQRHQRKIRYRRADRSGHAKIAIHHSWSAAVYGKMHKMQLDQCHHCTYSSEAQRIFARRNHHNDIGWKWLRE
jgi:hypothetical protein